jgi:hypothetical protein
LTEAPQGDGKRLHRLIRVVATLRTSQLFRQSEVRLIELDEERERKGRGTTHFDSCLVHTNTRPCTPDSSARLSPSPSGPALLALLSPLPPSPLKHPFASSTFRRFEVAYGGRCSALESTGGDRKVKEANRGRREGDKGFRRRRNKWDVAALWRAMVTHGRDDRRSRAVCEPNSPDPVVQNPPFPHFLSLRQLARRWSHPPPL